MLNGESPYLDPGALSVDKASQTSDAIGSS